MIMYMNMYMKMIMIMSMIMRVGEEDDYDYVNDYESGGKKE